MPRGNDLPRFPDHAPVATWEHLERSREGLRRRAALLLRPLHDGEPWRCVLAPGDQLHASFTEHDLEEAGKDALLRGLALALAKIKMTGKVLDAADQERQSLRGSIESSGIEVEGFSDQTSTYALNLGQYRQRYGQHRGAVERL